MRASARSVSSVPVSVFLLTLGLLGAGCGAAPEAAPPPRSPGAPPSPASTEVTSSPAPRALRRADVRRTIRTGLGAFLQRVVFEDTAVFEGGKFKGFKIATLAGDPSFWAGVDLRRGDVVMRINGKPIERPEQALAAFHSLETAPELRVSLERGGQPRELAFPIEGDPNDPPASATGTAPAGTPASLARPGR